ncbi:MAG: cysteine dioxygenase family protein [Verrucomicrobiota bacterium]|nr:cysteine dioxygenase family protein [Verrucomicrobiota bacterium]
MENGVERAGATLVSNGKMAVTVQACHTTKTTAFCRFVACVRVIVRTAPDPQAVGCGVADLLQPYLGSDDFLPCDQLAPAEADYCQHILHVEPDGSFSIVALVWLPGQATAVHDHVSWCVVGVHKGEEHEIVYQVNGENGDAHLRPVREQINPCGAVAMCIPPGDVHRVANGGEGVAVSVHVYGADISALGSSIRRRYNLEVRASA